MRTFFVSFLFLFSISNYAMQIKMPSAKILQQRLYEAGFKKYADETAIHTRLGDFVVVSWRVVFEQYLLSLIDLERNKSSFKDEAKKYGRTILFCLLQDYPYYWDEAIKEFKRYDNL